MQNRGIYIGGGGGEAFWLKYYTLIIEGKEVILYLIDSNL